MTYKMITLTIDREGFVETPPGSKIIKIFGDPVRRFAPNSNPSRVITTLEALIGPA